MVLLGTFPQMPFGGHRDVLLLDVRVGVGTWPYICPALVDAARLPTCFQDTAWRCWGWMKAGVGHFFKRFPFLTIDWK